MRKTNLKNLSEKRINLLRFICRFGLHNSSANNLLRKSWSGNYVYDSQKSRKKGSRSVAMEPSSYLTRTNNGSRNKDWRSEWKKNNNKKTTCKFSSLRIDWLRLRETLWGLAVAVIRKKLEIQKAERLKTAVAFLEDPSLAPSFLIGQLMTVCITPAPINETDMLVHFCNSRAREAEVGESGIQSQPWLQKKVWDQPGLIRISFKKPSKQKFSEYTHKYNRTHRHN